MTDEPTSLDIRGGKKEGEIRVNQSIIDELHSLDSIKMAGKSSVIRSIIDELHFLDIQGDQMEGESGVT